MSALHRLTFFIFTFFVFFSILFTSFMFVHKQNTNNLIAECIKETKDFVSCEKIYKK